MADRWPVPSRRQRIEADEFASCLSIHHCLIATASRFEVTIITSTQLVVISAFEAPTCKIAKAQKSPHPARLHASSCPLPSMPTPTSLIVEGLEQLSTTTSRPSTPPTEKQNEAEASPGQMSEGGILQIAGSGQSAFRLQRKLKVLHDLCPKDEPLEHDITYGEKDVRGLGPLTIQYRSLVSSCYFKDCRRQDEVIAAVWKQVQNLLPGHDVQAIRPSVVFDYVVMDEKRFPTVNVKFSTAEVFAVVREKLRMIQVGRGKKEAIRFVQYCWTNTLPGRVLAVDILSFPEEDATTKEFRASLQHMFSGVGQVLGAGAVMLLSAESEAVPANIIRVYVKLDHHAIKLDFVEYVNLVKTKLYWKGTRYTMCWAGRNSSKQRLCSLDYPDKLPAASSYKPSATSSCYSGIDLGVD